jgi:hypothetical protein
MTEKPYTTIKVSKAAAHRFKLLAIEAELPITRYMDFLVHFLDKGEEVKPFALPPIPEQDPYYS